MHTIIKLSILSVAILLSVFGTAAESDAQTHSKVKLILQITIDGLRADLLNRYANRFSKDGFRYLLKNGTVFTNAHYQHANTETIVGHTTLATGVSPSQHGMVGNVWYDREAGELAYNIEDPLHPLLPTGDNKTTGEQIDPTQILARSKGRSPAAILAPTLSDTLAAFYNGRSKIFGVSSKDRSAVSMAGHTGKAFWYSTESGDYVTSRYYYDEYPQWVRQWNAQRNVEKLAGTKWNLLHDKSSYLFGAFDDRSYETDLKGFGRVFPHTFGELDNKYFYTQVMVSPKADGLLLDFTKSLIQHERIGQDRFPDFLSVSFSAVDAVNHFFGPSSLENEDTVLHLDRTMAKLFTFINKSVGLKHTLIVLSADHGMADMPEYISGLGYKAGRIYPDDITKLANIAGQNLFAIEDVVRFFFRPYLYLDDKKIRAAKLEFDLVTKRIAEELSKHTGIALAVSRNGLPSIQMTPLLKQIERNYHPSRSGDIYIAQQPYWFMFEKGPVAAMHGSPWQYDTHVPIIFAGPDIKSRRVNRLVHPVDVAPTMAIYLGMTPPGAAHGEALVEVLD